MAHLVTVTGDRLDLRAGESYTIGRSSECDIPLADTASSREHARIEMGRRDWDATLVDLDSRNGTYVNGHPLDGPRELGHGDRLRIGTTSLFFLARDHLANAGAIWDPDSETDAIDVAAAGASANGAGAPGVLALPTPDGAALTGQLSSFSVVDLLQMMFHGRRSGSLQLSMADGDAEIEIRDGDVLKASFRGTHGVPALFAIVLKAEGNFSLLERRSAVETNVGLPTQQLLFELCRVLDEHDNESA